MSKLEPDVTWSCGAFCKLSDEEPTAHFWVQFLNFELDAEWMLKLDTRCQEIALRNDWRRDDLFIGKSFGIEMSCSWTQGGTTPLMLLMIFLHEMKLDLKDASQFIVDEAAIEAEPPEEEDD